MHYALLPILVSYTLLLLVLAQHSVLFAMVFSLSVSLSITLWYFVKSAKLKIMGLS